MFFQLHFRPVKLRYGALLQGVFPKGDQEVKLFGGFAGKLHGGNGIDGENKSG